MISVELRTELEKIPCTLKHDANYQYLSDDGKGNIKMKCPKCQSMGIGNIITVKVTPKKSTEGVVKMEKLKGINVDGMVRYSYDCPYCDYCLWIYVQPLTGKIVKIEKGEKEIKKVDKTEKKLEEDIKIFDQAYKDWNNKKLDEKVRRKAEQLVDKFVDARRDKEISKIKLKYYRLGKQAGGT